MRAFYTIGIVLYGIIVSLAAPWNKKAALWVQGRKRIIQNIQADLKDMPGQSIWIHSASLGEFEQGRPLIEKLKEAHPELKIIITFFSPSGYEIRKDYPLADYVYYLPEDTPSNAHQLIAAIQPKLAVFIKYEYWYNYMNALHSAQIPLIFVSGIFRPSQPFFQFYGGWFLKHLKYADHFFVQNEMSLQLLKEAGISQVSLSGDTRFDRVAEIASKVKANDIVKNFKSDSRLLLAGSTWPEDEKLLQSLAIAQTQLKIIIAPHLIDENHILQIEALFQGALRYSQVEDQNLERVQVLIIDNMGMLSSLYQYADMAFIGGGFGAGIHNTLEAATFGMPIFIGPNYQKFQEAKDLREQGVIQVIEKENQLHRAVENLLIEDSDLDAISQKAKCYVQSNTGATDVILGFIYTILK